ncbi:MAG: Integral membrane protein, partial [uncultured Solirubrobacteraceae bacterium]
GGVDRLRRHRVERARDRRRPRRLLEPAPDDHRGPARLRERRADRGALLRALPRGLRARRRVAGRARAARGRHDVRRRQHAARPLRGRQRGEAPAREGQAGRRGRRLRPARGGDPRRDPGEPRPRRVAHRGRELHAARRDLLLQPARVAGRRGGHARGGPQPEVRDHHLDDLRGRARDLRGARPRGARRRRREPARRLPGVRGRGRAGVARRHADARGVRARAPVELLRDRRRLLRLLHARQRL